MGAGPPPAGPRTRVARARATGLVAALAAVVGLGGCAGDPVLLDRAAFDDVEDASHDTWTGNVPGPTWCDSMAPGGYTIAHSPGTVLSFGERGLAGAVVVDRSSDGIPAERVLAFIEEQADVCTDSSVRARGHDIEPLTDLDEGEVGWSTRRNDGEWGEYVLVPLDEWRLLAVGFSTFADEAPVDRDVLVAEAVEGAGQFPASAARG
ncbi:hypothetical protein Cpa01nite_23070 [Cellulomonas pakistanensis]|uniref:Uncharacterized protein n=1 Tax=Cellulomonas pakistanensis TaxID=992287 RepID=A0A919U403_9CELL|nr:hypothetical protein Cpa01nite_23070 [Cellulomonas pakistanensis]